MLGEKIKYLRYRYNISQRYLANKLCVTISTISMYEQNKRIPSIYTLKEIANFFNVSIDSLLDDSIKSPYYKSSTPIKRVDQKEETKSFQELLIEYGYSEEFEKISRKEINNIMKFIVNNKKFIKNQK